VHRMGIHLAFVANWAMPLSMSKALLEPGSNPRSVGPVRVQILCVHGKGDTGWRAFCVSGTSNAPNQLVFIGECGPGKTHLARGLSVAACRAEAAGSLYHRGWLGERTGGSLAAKRSRAGAGSLIAVRGDRAERSWPRTTGVSVPSSCSSEPGIGD
jgi:hypothetical protein